jgi:nucleotide-binding universal stress UspA family protein
MFRNILVPLDGSARAEQAVGLAHSVAKSGEGRITLVQVVNNFDPLMINPYVIDITGDNGKKIVASRVAKASEYLTRVAEGVNASRVSGVGTKVLRGNAAEALCALASDGYDLVVMSTHGRTGLTRALLGSVAMAVVREAHLPVMLINDHQQADYPKGDYRIRTILVPLDGTALAEQALPPAVGLAKSSHAKLLLLKVLIARDKSEVYIVHEVGREEAENYDYVLGNTDLDDYRYLEEVSARYIPAEIAYTTIACAGQPAQDIISTLDDHHADLVVMATHARAGLHRIIAGSVAERVVSQASVPVLLLRGQAPPSAGAIR